ncbi:MAG: peptidoglycan DD-metalloendopeptidase family protein [Candidatus Marinimicrobia bacterium]|nr:peptidoglycan DD-metalloendopeptidase family protein [Candidatus Neomarinimicrobiota bacterium]
MDKLRREVKDFEKRIKETSEKEKSTTEKLSELDEEISLIRNLIYRLRKEEKIKKGAIEKAEGEIQQKEAEKKNLINRYANRVVNIYKKGRLSDLELLFDSESWQQAIYRTRYMKIISDYDRSLNEKIWSTIKEIKESWSNLMAELRDLERIDREKVDRKKWLERRRRMRNSELNRLKQDKHELAKALEERQKAAKELEAIIAKLEKEKAARLAELERRRREARELRAAENFSALKGKLPWPVDGAIISRFGRHRNPTLKTVTENPGIDIRGKSGVEVRAVFDGIVTTITYIRGYGNTIIIDHGGGYYTVYTHIMDVEVDEGGYVKALDTIARVGDSGSLDGAKLHFEIWGNKQKLNPELWLRKS